MGLLRLFSHFRQATVDDDSITVATLGLERSEQKLVSTMRRAAAAARRLHGLDKDNASVDRLLNQRVAGELAQTLDEVRAVVHPHPDDLDSQLFELETLATGGRTQEAASLLERLEAVLPADPEVEGWRDYLTPMVRGVGGWGLGLLLVRYWGGFEGIVVGWGGVAGGRGWLLSVGAWLVGRCWGG